MKLSIKDLRHLLFAIGDQNMEVGELRKELFDINDVDYYEKLSLEDWKNLIRKKKF